MSNQEHNILKQQVLDQTKINKGLELKGNLPLFAIILIIFVLFMNAFISG